MALNIENERSPYYERLSGDVKQRYDEKIQECNGIDPYTLKPKHLSSNQKDFPHMTIYDITNYMIHSMSSYTKRFFENYKGTEAYKFFESGFVLNIGAKNFGSLAIVTGKVLHSQRLNDSASHVWLLSKLDGNIICAHCTCVVGLSETCSHVGAICFAIHKISESKETKSVTDILCKWNVPKFKEVSMSAARDIDWRCSAVNRATNETSFLEFCDSIVHLSDERIDRFLDDCNSFGDDVALRSIIFPSERKRLTNLKDEIFLSSLYNSNYKNKSLRELIDIGRANLLNLSEDEVHEIFRLTLPQLKAKCYLGLRRGRITGSTFKNCCTTTPDDPSIVTINRVISPIKNLSLIPSIKYRIRNKKKAIERYLSQAVLIHKDFVHAECGLIINPNLPYFAGSPDGLIYCSCHGDGCLEIICVDIDELKTLDDFLTRKPNNMFNKIGDKYTVERSHDLFYRIQLQINLNCSNYCDCMIWTQHKAIVVKVFADTDFWRVAADKASKFHEQVIMPELLGKFFTSQNKDLTESNENEDECGEEDFEEEKLQLLAIEIEILESDGEEDFEDQGLELLDLNVEILESEEWKKCIAPQSISSETITSTIVSSKKPENQLNDCQQSGSSLPQKQNIYSDLKSLSLKEVCSTFGHHEQFLTDVYNRFIKEPKRNYFPKDLPSFAALDLVTEKQFEAMVEVAHLHLHDEHPKSSDVIFEAIIAEWAYKVFCDKYNLNRQQAAAAVLEMNSSKEFEI